MSYLTFINEVCFVFFLQARASYGDSDRTVRELSIVCETISINDFLIPHAIKYINVKIGPSLVTFSPVEVVRSFVTGLKSTISFTKHLIFTSPCNLLKFNRIFCQLAINCGLRPIFELF